MTQAISVVLGCPLLLHDDIAEDTTLVVGHREVNFKATRGLPPYWLAFIVPEGPIQPAEGKKTLVVLPSAGRCNTNWPVKCVPWCDSAMTGRE